MSGNLCLTRKRHQAVDIYENSTGELAGSIEVVDASGWVRLALHFDKTWFRVLRRELGPPAYRGLFPDVPAEADNWEAFAACEAQQHTSGDEPDDETVALSLATPCRRRHQPPE